MYPCVKKRSELVLLALAVSFLLLIAMSGCRSSGKAVQIGAPNLKIVKVVGEDSYPVGGIVNSLIFVELESAVPFDLIPTSVSVFLDSVKVKECPFAFRATMERPGSGYGISKAVICEIQVDSFGEHEIVYVVDEADSFDEASESDNSYRRVVMVS